MHGEFHRGRSCLDSDGVFFFVLFSLARFGLNLGFLDRPVVIGLFWSALTGQWAVAIPVALFYELFYLDLFPLGTFIPPHAPFALLVTLALTNIFDLSQPSLVFVVLCLSMPAAWLGSKLEGRHRQWQNLSYTRMLQSTRPGQEHIASATGLARNALIQVCIIQGLAFILVMTLLTPIAEWVLLQVRTPVLDLPVGWPHIWMLGALGALLSFRTRKIYAAFLVMTAAVGIWFSMSRGLL
jgi:PTS system mannose-specific IIC component